MKLKDIFIKKNIMPLIGLALTLFGLVMIVIAGDWANIVWPVIVLFLIFKGFKSTHNTMELQNSYAHAEQQLNEVRKNRDDYMHAYKEYWNKYDAKDSECKILEHKIQELQDQLQIANMPDPVVAAKPAVKKTRVKKSAAAIKSELKDVTANLKKKKN